MFLTGTFNVFMVDTLMVCGKPVATWMNRESFPGKQSYTLRPLVAIV